MNLHQLRNLVAIVDRGGINDAAAALRVPPSTLSQSLRSLEQSLGLELFHRIGRGLVLSTAGEEVIRRARPLLRDTDVARGRISGTDHQGEVPPLIIGCPSELAARPVADMVGPVRRTYPESVVHVVSMMPEDAPATLLDESRCDVVISPMPEDLPPHLAALPAGVVRLWLAAPPGTALRDTTVPAASLSDLPLIRGSQAAVDARALTPDGQPASDLVVAHIEAHVELVLAGVGTALLEESVALQSQGRGVEVRPLSPPIEVRLGLSYHPARLSHLARELIRLSGLSGPGETPLPPRGTPQPPG